MKATKQLHDLGQSVWLDNITRELLTSGTLSRVSGTMPGDGGDAEDVLAEFSRAGVDAGQLANELQREGAEAFDKSWNDLMECLAAKSRLLKKAG